MNSKSKETVLFEQQQLYLYSLLINLIQNKSDKIWREYRLPVITING